MPVSTNKESGVLSRPTSICSSAIPIKKRRFPYVRLASPPREEAPSPSVEMNDRENERESTANDLSVVASSSKDLIQKPDVITNYPEVAKKESVVDVNDGAIRTDICREPQKLGSCQELQTMGGLPPTRLDVKNELPCVLGVSSVQSIEDLGKCRDEKISPAVISDSVDKVVKFNSVVTETSTGNAVLTSNLRFPTVNVKREMVNIGSEGVHEHERSTALGNTELCLTPNELVDSSLQKQRAGLSTNGRYELPPPLLSLSVSKTELPDNLCADKTVSSTDSNVIMPSTDRSNWDLNTTMDAWEGSVEGAASRDIIGAHELGSSRVTHETKQFMSSTSVVDIRLDKGKRVMEPTEGRSTPYISSMPSGQFNFEDSLLLSLSTSSPQTSNRVYPHLSLQRPIINSIPSGSGTVKAEPVDDSLKPAKLLVPDGTMESLDNQLVYMKTAETYDKTLVGNFRKVIEATSFKSEVSHNSNQESHSSTSFTLERPISNIVQLHDKCSSSSTVVSPSATPQQHFVSKLTTLSELSGSEGVLDQSEHDSNAKGIYIKDMMNSSITSEMPQPANMYFEGPNVCDDSKVNSSEAMTSSLPRSDENKIEPNSIIVESAYDKVKISSMLEDDSYGLDSECDGNHGVLSQMGRDDDRCEKVDDDYEDGEVREFQVKSLVSDPTCEGILSENNKEADDGCQIDAPTIHQSTIIGEQSDSKLHNGSNNHNECIEAMTDGNDNQLVSDYVSLLVTKSEQVTSVETEAKVQENFLDNLSVVENAHVVEENDTVGDGETNVKDIVLATVSVIRNEVEKGSNEAGMNDKGSYAYGVPESSLAKEEVTFNEQDSFKDSAVGSNRSRIITLPRASDSPSRIKSLSGRAFTTWSGRERYGEADGDNSNYRGHRAEAYGDDSRKFPRDRSFRNSRVDFKRDRGRGTGRFDSVHNKWDPEHDFPSKSFGVSDDHRFNRHRRASAVADNGLRSNDFAIAPGVTGPSAGRIGRNPLVEEFHSFRHPSSSRLSPGYRDGSTIRSLPNSRRLPESGSDLPGLRHEKFLRGLPDDITTRPQASYDEMGGQFVNGNQDYSTVQRRFFPRARSKSPGSSQTRSPGTWTSSRRRFNDDFNNPSEQIQHRSLMYREERMRSPDRVCYTDELGDRRRVAPNHVTHRPNEMRDIDFTREQGNLRSVSSSQRSPSDRVFPRSTRRLDVLDSRERTESDEYFSGTINSGRFREFRSDGGNDERRKFGERRGQFRPSRPSYGGGNENYRINAEDGPLKFCSDQETDSFERSNIRQRGFDGGAKTRPFIAQRQIRSTEDQEGSFGQSGQVWHDDSFSDGSRMKKRRF